jgi:hypothetical protein
MNDTKATSPHLALNPFTDLFRRLRSKPAWVAAQFWATLLLVLAGVAWTRLPDKHAWQVLLSLLVPLLMVIATLALEAGTMRALADDDSKRVKLVLGAATLVVWVAVFWVCWAILDWCDDRIPQWAGYLNSQASAHTRARLLTYEHLQRWFTLAEWALRWIVVPAKVIPCAMASAQWAWRLPFRRVLRLLWNWRWWLAVVLTALVTVVLPGRFFAGVPHGTVAHQIWAVVLKLAGAFLLALVCWVLLLAWAAVLFVRTQRSANPSNDSLVPAPVRSGPLGEGSVRLPLPESGDDSGGKA